MQQRLVRSLYQEANISPEQVEYVEAHGTGTKVNAHSSFLITLRPVFSSGLCITRQKTVTHENMFSSENEVTFTYTHIWSLTRNS